MKQVDAKPAVSSVGAGLIASLCCGGSLVFASIGLGAFYGALGLSRYIPQALAAGALCIVMINYLFYRKTAERVHRAGTRNIADLRQAMFASAVLGLATMAVSFVFLEWLNHAVVSAHFLFRPEYGQALIPGVPNVRLLYALASFWALALLWALPWPRLNPMGEEVPVVLQRGLWVGVFAVTVGVLVVLIANAMSGGSGHGSWRNTSTPQHDLKNHRMKENNP
jgi:hypothetical protein